MAKSCSVAHCEKPYHGRGLCKGHHANARRDGTLPPPRTAEERFWSKVKKGAPGECWEWTSSHDGRYGTFSLNRKKLKAHRLAYEWAKGAIPPGLQVDHICWNTRCVNPDHLRLATNAQNNQNHRGARSNSKSRVRGVIRQGNRWRADARLDNVSHYLGLYRTIEEAEAVVRAWRKENMPFSMMDRAA